MHDSNEPHKIAIEPTGLLIPVPNPAYRPPPPTPAPAASTPHVDMSGATADEPMVIDSSDDDFDFDNGLTANVYQRSRNPPIKLDSPSEEEDELELDADADAGTGDALAFASIEGDEDNDRARDSDNEHDNEDEDDEVPRESPRLPFELDIADENQDVRTSPLVTPAIESPARGDLTSEGLNRSPSSPSTSEIFNVDWAVDEPTTTTPAPALTASTTVPPSHSQSSPSTSEIFGDKSGVLAPASSEPDLTPDTPAYESSRHQLSAPSEADLADDLEDDDLDTLPDMNLELPITSRVFWERRIRIANEGNLSISAILNRLGLRRGSGTRGVVSFEDKTVRRLANEVAHAANALPVEHAEDLVDIASQPDEMSETVDGIFRKFGDEVWGGVGRSERKWLMDKEVGDGLWRENTDDVVVIKEFIRLWIIVKAINMFNYLKYKNPGVKTKGMSKSRVSNIGAKRRAARHESEEELSSDEMDISDDEIYDNIVVVQPPRPKDPEKMLELDGQHGEGASGLNEHEIRETPEPMEHTTTMSPGLPEVHLESITPTELATEMANTSMLDSEVAATQSAALLPSTESCPENHIMEEDPMEPSLEEAQVPEADTTLENGTGAAATLHKTSEAGGSALRKTKAALDTLSPSPAAAAVPESSSARPIRSTRKAMPTYNLAILNGRARHTPTKYLEKHHKNVLHGSVDELRTGNPYNPSEIAHHAQSGARRPQTVSATPELLDQGNEIEEPVPNEHPPTLTQSFKKGPVRRRRATSASSVESPKRPVSKKAKSKESPNTPSAALTTSFTTYLQATTKDPSVAVPLLDTIERDIMLLTPHLVTLLKNADLEMMFLASVFAWLNLQRTIHSVRERLSMPPEPQHKPTHVKMMRSRMLTELRVARDKYIEAQQDRAGTGEDVLCVGFEGMQDENRDAKRVVKVVSEGLMSLDELLRKLGDELGFGGGEWVRVG